MMCLNGFTTLFSEENCQIGDYTSRWKCKQHSECLALPHSWPQENIQNEWRLVNKPVPETAIFQPENPPQQSISPLLKNATTCSLCSLKGKWMCVHDGHMLCDEHAIKRTCHGSLKSPLSCSLTLKNAPLWPNPWAFMYQTGVTLSPGHRCLTDCGMIAFSVNFQLTVPSFHGHLQIDSWAHSTDRFPRRHLIKGTSTYLPAWRICILPIKNTPTLTDFHRCRLNWTKSILFILRQVNLTWAKFPHFHLNTFSAQTFMYLNEPNSETICIWCHCRYKSLELFAQSKCSLFELKELQEHSISSSDPPPRIPI